MLQPDTLPLTPRVLSRRALFPLIQCIFLIPRYIHLSLPVHLFVYLHNIKKIYTKNTLDEKTEWNWMDLLKMGSQ